MSVGQLKTWRLEQQAAGATEAFARQKAEATELRRVVKENRDCHGPLRVFHKLIQDGIECTLYLIRKLMKSHNIRQPGRKKLVPGTTDSNHNNRIALNLLDRDFPVFQPNKVWLAAGTEQAQCQILAPLFKGRVAQSICYDCD